MPAPILITNYDVSQIFLGKNRYEDFTYTNSTGSTVTLLPGRLLGIILATNKVLPNVSTATDGSEIPACICADTYVVADGVTLTITAVTKGMINYRKVIFGGSDTLATAIRTVSTGGGVMKFMIEKIGLILEDCTEQSNYDNA